MNTAQGSMLPALVGGNDHDGIQGRKRHCAHSRRSQPGSGGNGNGADAQKGTKPEKAGAEKGGTAGVLSADELSKAKEVEETTDSKKAALMIQSGKWRIISGLIQGDDVCWVLIRVV